MSTARKTFTLVELLVVIAIIAILAGLLLPALSSASQHAKRTKALTEMKLLQTAIAMYESDYGVLPWSGGKDQVLVDDNDYEKLICYLQNRDPGDPENGTNPGNPRNKRYLDISTDQGPGVFNDPWHTESKPQRYQIALDLDYDGDIEPHPTVTD
ncbi:MAG: type II secretion system protein, partial [Lentisphaerae bacterium]|nr:type II secretion system protein [Lentisphaerota bacterium]